MNQETLKAKQEVVKSLVNEIKSHGSTIVCEYRGLTVAQLQDLRRTLRESNAKVGVYKNSLVTRAFEELGYKAEDLFVGPNAIIFSEDPISGLKVATKFAKKNSELVLKGGLVDGTIVDAKKAKELSALPGRDGVLSMFLSCLNSPIVGFACAVKAIADKQQPAAN